MDFGRRHAPLALIVLALLAGCSSPETPTDTRITTTLPGQGLGQTGTPKLYPPTTLEAQ